MERVKKYKLISKIIHRLRIRKILFKLNFYLTPSKSGSKVFCIGYNKTGTTSVGKAFSILGYKNLSFNKEVTSNYNNKNILKVLKYASKYDSFDDFPWMSTKMIPILDKVFPGSKFIHLYRDEEPWKKSWCNWHSFLGKSYDIELALKNYRMHNDFVYNYFKGRENIDFISLQVNNPNAFKKIAKFLGHTPPYNKLPYENRSIQ
jgi:hypothetical protein